VCFKAIRLYLLEHSERFPVFPVGLHMYANTTCPKAIAIWETDSPEKIAYKLARTAMTTTRKTIRADHGWGDDARLHAQNGR